MIRAKPELPIDVIRWMQSGAAGLWPAIAGSLSFRRSRCMRENCPACLSGEQHPSHVLYGRHNGRRFAVGRALQDLLVQAGPRYVKALKRERASAAKRTRG
jgi:hypothetical protein